jgi:hypothetical protein
MQNTLSEFDLDQLLRLKTEPKNSDYKEKMNWNDPKDNRIGIIKDIIGMANTQDGGKIIFGVRDSDYELVGLLKEDFESFDQTKVNALLHSYTEPKFSCQVYKHKTNINNDERLFVIIDVPEFREEIILCKNNYPPSGNDSGKILKSGYIYIRTEKGSTESISSAQEMRELLGRAIAKKGDELLNNIDRLIKGKPSKATEDSEEKYKEEMEEADKSFSEVIGDKLKQYGYWELFAYPVDYNQKRISGRKKQIKEQIIKCKVHLGNWYFPHQNFSYQTFSDEVHNFSKGIQSYINQDNLSVEGYRAYQSGLFVWKKAFVEDMQSQNKAVLYFGNVIVFITGFLLFFKRYYEEIVIDSSLHVKIKLNKTKDRVLVDYTNMGVLPIELLAMATEDNISIERDIRLIEVKASYKEIAKQIIMEIFELFNYEVNESAIDKIQSKYFGQAL